MIASKRDAAGLHAVGEVGQRIDQFAAHRAAQTSVRKFDDAVGGLLDEKVVDGDVAELVDDDGGVGERRIFQKSVEQRRLAGAEEAREDGDGDRDGGGVHRRAYWTTLAFTGV